MVSRLTRAYYREHFLEQVHRDASTVFERRLTWIHTSFVVTFKVLTKLVVDRDVIIDRVLDGVTVLGISANFVARFFQLAFASSRINLLSILLGVRRACVSTEREGQASDASRLKRDFWIEINRLGVRSLLWGLNVLVFDFA